MKGRRTLFPTVIVAAGFVLAVLVAGRHTVGAAGESGMGYKELTPDEERVIVYKGTERPFAGEYVHFDGQGTYLCRRCGQPLFRSADKFDSRSGWPSFDDAIADAVLRIPDADGARTEIVCSNCKAHLGHVFFGEKMTDKNVRNCVNSISLQFIPEEMGGEVEKAYFAGGCFWGTEYQLQQAKGVLSTRVGYMGGEKESPTYREVCSGRTGHAEALEVVFDPSITSFETLARLFFEIHDPTEVDRQGPDVGEQYRSAVFCVDDEQRRVTEKLIALLRGKGYDVATEVVEAGTFWEAEDYHQDYYRKNGKEPYCHLYEKRF